MPLQNRVTPLGEIIATSARGTLMGNRGILHGDDQTLGAARWRHQNWVTCALSFGGRKRTLMAPGKYTELFFLDEAVALAAGHRPCGECRHDDFRRFVGCWYDAHGGDAAPRAGEIDRGLHRARVHSRSREQIRFSAPLDAMPDGSFVRIGPDQTPWLVRADRLFPYAPEGYGRSRQRPLGIEVEVLTPRPTVAVLQAGYVPRLHPDIVEPVTAV